MFDYDVVIVSGGPAALTAGLYLGRGKRRVAALEKESPGGNIQNVEWIENYPGFVDGVPGAQLGAEMASQAMKYGLKLPILGNETYSVLVNVFPEWMPPNRFAFVDIWPAMEKAIMKNIKPEIVTSQVYKALLNDPNIEGIFNMLFCSKQFRALNNIDDIINIAENAPKPFYFWLVGEAKEVKRISNQLGQHNLPNFPSLEEMVKNFSILVQ